MRLTPTERRLINALMFARAHGFRVAGRSLAEQFLRISTDTLKVHANNLRRKGVPIRGYRGGRLHGGYYLEGEQT